MLGSISKLKPSVKVQQQSVFNELQGTDIFDVAAIAKEIADTSTNTNSPLFVATIDEETGLAILVNAKNIATLIIKYQAKVRTTFSAGTYFIFTKPSVTVVIPNFGLIDIKILQPFYAKNLSALTVRCKIEHLGDIGHLFKDQEDKLHYTLEELATQQQEIEKIVNEEKYYEIHPESPPPPRYLP